MWGISSKTKQPLAACLLTRRARVGERIGRKNQRDFGIIAAFQTFGFFIFFGFGDGGSLPSQIARDREEGG